MGVSLSSVSRAQRSTSEAKWCAADPGSSQSVAVPDQRRTAPLRFALHRIRDTWLKLTPMVLGLGFRFRGRRRRLLHPFPQLAPAATTHFNPCANVSFGGDL